MNPKVAALISAALFCFTASVPASAQEPVEDIVFLHNGSVIRGQIVDDDTNDRVKIQTKDGNLFVYDTGDVRMLCRDNQLETFSGSPSPEPENDMRSSEKIGFEQYRVPETEVDFGIKLVYFSPSEEVIKDMYGGGPAVEGELIIWKRSGFGTAFGIQRYAKSGEPYVYDPAGYVSSASADVTVVPITFTGMYRMIKDSPGRMFRPYFGAGVGIYVIREEIGAHFIDGSSAGDSASLNKMGFHMVGGLQVDVWRHASLVFDVKYAHASVSLSPDMIENDLNVGGFSIGSGLRF